MVDIGVKIDALTPDVNVLEATPPEAVSRVGWVSIAADYSFDLVTTEPIYEQRWWIDFMSQLFTFRPEEVGCRYIRWQLFPGLTGTIRVDT